MKPKKSLGQHFLSDVGILGRIADALEISPGETVLEIGPGQGSLTRVLLDRGARVIGIEKDSRLAERLREPGAGSRTLLQVVHADALEVVWAELAAGSEGTAPGSRISNYAVVGNIPYYITSPLLDKALTPPLPSRIVFLVQKEVADRIAAPPGSRTYGALSVGIQAACQVEKLFTVKAGAFRPPPKVDSAVLRLTPLAQPLVPVEQGSAFRRFVVACFGQRRKQLRNVLSSVVSPKGLPDGRREPGAVAEALRGMGIDPQARPETLSPADFARLLIWSGQL
ncbi:MAG TPA: 16S rRNA (adenine(1518)-N(6)/adenine(1519)-N(6))-dimethyltransferase RsmA [Gemmatimonadales bacterium]|nr:16S rRNA (adenine(1518)-N(6)/adenine(1519)-N(6))-dimethyltransferase RsmA [Gemmatimonadales bacterium]